VILINGPEHPLRGSRAHFGCSEGIFLVAKRTFVCFREIFGERPSGAWGCSATLRPASPLLTLFDTAEPWSLLEGWRYCTRIVIAHGWVGGGVVTLPGVVTVARQVGPPEVGPAGVVVGDGRAGG
jgi:hypothetical protein